MVSVTVVQLGDAGVMYVDPVGLVKMTASELRVVRAEKGSKQD
jgi:hypothetical protein